MSQIEAQYKEFSREQNLLYLMALCAFCRKGHAEFVDMLIREFKISCKHFDVPVLNHHILNFVFSVLVSSRYSSYKELAEGHTLFLSVAFSGSDRPKGVSSDCIVHDMISRGGIKSHMRSAVLIDHQVPYCEDFLCVCGEIFVHQSWGKYSVEEIAKALMVKPCVVGSIYQRAIDDIAYCERIGLSKNE